MAIGKLKKLKKILKEMGSALLAYSAGADSTFLLKIAAQALPKDKLLAVTADSPTYPKEELLSAKKITRSLGARHLVIRTAELKDKKFIANPRERCYFCKKELFTRLKKIAVLKKLDFVLDASNKSDLADFRPGALAKKELGIRSPLEEAGLNKKEIRALSKKFGLATADKPALACLASRLPYGTRITPEILRQIDKAEVFLRGLGFKQVRLRHYGSLCRIEVAAGKIPFLTAKRKQIIDKLKKLGYNYVTVDLEGYRTGSLNEVII